MKMPTSIATWRGARTRRRTTERNNARTVRLYTMRRNPTPRRTNRFKGSDAYVSTDDLTLAVNAADHAPAPLLVKGEPGTARPCSPWRLQRRSGCRCWNGTSSHHQGAAGPVRSTTPVSRLRDSQARDPRVQDIRNYIVKGMLWQAFTSERRSCSSSTKSTRPTSSSQRPFCASSTALEFFGLRDQGTRQGGTAPHRLNITSNNEKELPDAFLRRCFFHYIRSPTRKRWRNRRGALSGAEEVALARSARVFFEVREVPG